MHRKGIVSSGQGGIEAAAGARPRLPFADHLRVALVTLVVVHHVALVYGAGAPFYYVEPPFTEPFTYLILLLFVLANQAWFMGALFLLAGYFTPGSVDRRGEMGFVTGRLVRLGIPTLLFVLVLNPLASLGYWQMPSSLTAITTPVTLAAYPHLMGLGPMWFAVMLLVFSLGYAAWRRLARYRPPRSPPDSTMPGLVAIAGFVVLLAVASYLIRTVIPLGRYVLGFPTLSYLPQYAAFFALGILAARRDWLWRVPCSAGLSGLAIAVLATIVLLPLALSGRFFSLELAEPAGFVGNGHWQSAVYALWDSVLAVGMFVAAIAAFRRWLGERRPFSGFASRHSYAVYVLHVPIVVFVAIAMKDVELTALPKFALVSAITVPLCFGVAYLVHKAPLVARVL